MLYQNCFVALMMSIWKCNDFCKVYIPTTIITGYPTNPLMEKVHFWLRILDYFFHGFVYFTLVKNHVLLTIPLAWYILH